MPSKTDIEASLSYCTVLETEQNNGRKFLKTKNEKNSEVSG